MITSLGLKAFSWKKATSGHDLDSTSSERGPVSKLEEKIVLSSVLRGRACSAIAGKRAKSWETISFRVRKKPRSRIEIVRPERKIGRGQGANWHPRGRA